MIGIWIMNHLAIAIPSAVGAAFVAWLTGLFGSLAPKPATVKCFIREALLDVIYLFPRMQQDNRFTILVAQLASDREGVHTRAVARAFQGISGIERIGTCRVLRLQGIGIRAEARAHRLGRKWLKRRRADLLIWGEVLQQEKAIHLWFLTADTASDFSNSRFELSTNLLKEDFVDVANTQLVSVALSSIKPLKASNDIYLVETLKPLASKLETLTHLTNLTERQRIEIRAVRGAVLSAIGEQSADYEIQKEAAAVLEHALEALKPDVDPELWATTQHRLGVALSRAATFEISNDKLVRSLDAFRMALRIRPRNTRPLEWATTQNNIGVALNSLAERTGEPTYLVDAVNAFQLALEERKRDVVPDEWALTQHNLAQALLRRARIERSPADFETAIAKLREVSATIERRKRPLIWAMLHHSLASALRESDENRTNSPLVVEAISLFRLAGEEWSYDKVPARWMMLQNNLATALMCLAERNGDVQLIAEAIDLAKAAIDRCDAQHMPRLWATLKNTLGNLLLRSVDLKYRPTEVRITGIDIPVDATTAAPGMDWGRAQRDLGYAVEILQKRETAESELQEAAESLKEALVPFAGAASTNELASTQNTLGLVLTRLGEYTKDSDFFWDAVSWFKQALAHWPRDEAPLKWSMVQHNLGIAYIKIGTVSSGVEELSIAISALEAALEIRLAADNELQIADTECSLSAALYHLGQREPGIDSLKRSIDFAEQAVERLKRVGATHRIPLVINNKVLAETLITSRLEDQGQQLGRSH